MITVMTPLILSLIIVIIGLLSLLLLLVEREVPVEVSAQIYVPHAITTRVNASNPNTTPMRLLNVIFITIFYLLIMFQVFSPGLPL